LNVVSPSYFDAMGLSLMAGLQFSEQSEPGECRIAIVNREAADLYFGGNAVGSAVIDFQGVRSRVIGVVNSTKIGNFQRHAEPAIYFPMAQDYPLRMTLIAAGRSPTDLMLATLRQGIAAVPGHGSEAVAIKKLSEHLSHTALAPLRIASVIVGSSASTALALSVLGLFSALNDAGRQRRRELAIRIALGAGRGRVIRQVLSKGGRLACAGLLLGTIGSWALARFLGTVVSGNTSSAWWVWLAAPLGLGVAVVLASLIPARRALIVNPVTIMREES